MALLPAWHHWAPAAHTPTSTTHLPAAGPYRRHTCPHTRNTTTLARRHTLPAAFHHDLPPATATTCWQQPGTSLPWDSLHAASAEAQHFARTSTRGGPSALTWRRRRKKFLHPPVRASDGR